MCSVCDIIFAMKGNCSTEVCSIYLQYEIKSSENKYNFNLMGEMAKIFVMENAKTFSVISAPSFSSSKIKMYRSMYTERNGIYILVHTRSHLLYT